MPKDVITLQFGGLANYVGAHYWNIQDELLGLQSKEETASLANQIDCNVLYRERLGIHGESSYTPRLVLFDAKGSLGGHGFLNTYQESLEAIPSPSATWDGRHAVHRAAPIPKSQFIHQLEVEEEEKAEEPAEKEVSKLESAAFALDAPGAVKYFTDFLKAPVHQRSIHLVNGIWKDSPEIQNWCQPGGWLGSNIDSKEEATEKIRILAEESNSLAGFQLLVDDLSCWGGCTSEILQEIRDDYGDNRSVMLWALRNSNLPPSVDSITPAEFKRRRLLEGLSTGLLTYYSDIYCPLAAPPVLPFLHYRPGDIFHEASILAAALDTATLPYRLMKNTLSESPGLGIGGLDFWSMSNLLTGQFNTPLCAFSLALPCPNVPQIDAQKAAHDIDSREKHEDSHGKSKNFTEAAVNLTGSSLGGGRDSKRFAEIVTLRGARSGGHAVNLNSAASILDAALLREPRARCVQHRTISGFPMPVPLPFPNIFSKNLTVDGEPRAVNADIGTSHHVVSCPVLTRLAGTAAFGPVVGALSRQWTSAARDAQGSVALDSWGIDREQVDEVSERLHGLAHAYDEED